MELSLQDWFHSHESTEKRLNKTLNEHVSSDTRPLTMNAVEKRSLIAYETNFRSTVSESLVEVNEPLRQQTVYSQRCVYRASCIGVCPVPSPEAFLLFLGSYWRVDLATRHCNFPTL